MITCKSIQLTDKKKIDAYLKGYQPNTSEMTFTNLFMWAEYYHFQYGIVNDVLWVIGEVGGTKFAYMPIPGPHASLEKSIGEMKDFFREWSGGPLYIQRADERTVTRLGSLISQWEPDRNNSDYVYASYDLIHLEGKKYHRKRNHIHQFQESVTNYEYMPLDADLITECIHFQRDWCRLRDCKKEPSLLCEQDAILKAFAHYQDLALSGAAIVIDGEVKAFTFGEMLNQDTAVIHIEKAHPDVPGLYTAVNQLFCEKQWKNAAFINREQDLGIPGLRRAKESYYPHHLANKYTLWI